MLWRLISENDGALPTNMEAVFTNTGKEVEPTYQFLQDIEDRWGIPVTWLEYTYRQDAAGGTKDPKHHYRVVDFDTASRDGEPFAELIVAKRYLPNQSQRLCTQNLKVETAARYMRRQHGIARKDYISILGATPRRA